LELEKPPDHMKTPVPPNPTPHLNESLVAPRQFLEHLWPILPPLLQLPLPLLLYSPIIERLD
jgi:hypothetical protein